MSKGRLEFFSDEVTRVPAITPAFIKNGLDSDARRALSSAISCMRDPHSEVAAAK